MEYVDKIKEIQNLIDKYGFGNEPEFRSIMNIDVENFNDDIEYYRNLKGKHLMYKHNGRIKLIYFHPDMKILNYGFSLKKQLKVTVDRYDFSVSNTHLTVSFDTDHVLSSAIANRYSDYTEITEEEFKSYINKFNSIINNANTEIING